MTRYLSLALLSLMSLGLAACGGDGPAAPVSASTTPQEVVNRWIAAAKAGDVDAALALGTDTWAERERTWNRSFTTAMTTKGWRLKSADVQAPATQDDGTVRVRVGAVFIDGEGKEDSEGLGFVLTKGDDGVWRITKLG